MGARAIGTLGVIDTLTIGGRVFSDLTNLKSLGAGVLFANYTTFRSPNSTSGYQVTTGKTFNIYAIKSYTANVDTNAAGSFNIGYANADAGLNGAAPSTIVYMGGDIGQAHILQFSSRGNEVALATPFGVPSQKYPFVTGNSAGQIQCFAFGYEV